MPWIFILYFTYLFVMLCVIYLLLLFLMFETYQFIELLNNIFVLNGSTKIRSLHVHFYFTDTQFVYVPLHHRH